MTSKGASQEFDGLRQQIAALTRELAETRQQQAATAEVLRAISRSVSDLQSVLDRLVASVARLCEADHAWLFRRRGDEYLLAASYGFSRGQHESIKKIILAAPVSAGRGSIVARVALTGGPVHVFDVAVDPDYDMREVQEIGGYRTVLGVPLLRENALIGIISVTRSQVKPFSERQIDLMTTFADQAAIAIENARLIEEVQNRNRKLTEALEQQTATSEILRVISTSPTDMQPVFETIVRNAVALCSGMFANVFRFDGEFLHFVAGHNIEPGRADLLSAKYPMRPDLSQVSGRVMLTKSVVRLEDVLADPEYDRRFLTMTPWRRMLGVPLLRKGDPIGVFVVAWADPGPIPKAQEELLRTFADQAVIAIENARLFEEVQARNAELQETLEQQIATGTILRAIAASPTDIQPVLDVVAESAARLLDNDDVSIALRSGDMFSISAYHGSIPASVDPFPVDRSFLTGRAVIERRPIQVDDLWQAESEYPGSHAFAKSLGHRTMLVVPLLREDTAIGVALVRRREVKPFTQKQIDLLKTFADQAVIAIENVRLFEAVQARTSELTEALQQQTATAEVLQVISRSAFDLQTVFDALVASAARLCEAEGAIIFRRRGEKYHVEATYGMTPSFMAYMEQHPVTPDRGSTTGRAILEGRPVQIEDTLVDPEYRWQEAQAIAGWRAILAVPLMRENSPIGAIALLHTTPRPFTPRQVDLVTTFADQAVIAIENVRLFDEVQARNRELTEALEQQMATSTILRAIAASPADIQPVLRTVAESAAKLCKAFDAVIFLKDGGRLVPKAHFGDIPITVGEAPIDRGWASGRAFLDRKPIQVEDALEVGEEFPLSLERTQRLGHRTVLATPLLREGEAVGTIVIRRLEVLPFTRKQVDLLATFADQAVIAIENARLFEEVQARTRELQESLEYQTAISNVLAVISRAPTDLQPVLDTIVETAKQLCGADRTFFSLLREGTYQLAASCGAPRRVIEELSANPVGAHRGSPAGRAILEKRPVHIPDVGADPEFTLYDPNDTTRARTILSVPLVRENEVVGVISASRMVLQPFNQRQIDLLKTFADQAVIAIQNVRLFEEVQARTAELARSVGELRALGEVSQAVNSTLDSTTVLETIVAKAVQLSHTDAGAIYVYDDSDKVFGLRATYGMDETLIAAISSHAITIDDPGIGDAARERRTIQMPDLEKEVQTAASIVVYKAGFRSILIVPLLRGDEIVGALVVRRRAKGVFPQATIDLMQTFAAQSVQAIQNARLFSEIEEKGRELEIASRHKSQFLANMSHELRTPLNSVLGFTEMLVDGLYGDLPEKAKTTLGRVQANGRHLLGLINDVLDLSKIEAGQLRLAIDDYMIGQILKTVEAATEPLARNKGLALSVEVPPGLPLGRGDERRLTQVLLNLAGNAVKFTDKGSIAISARARDGHFELFVTDTGPGIAPEHQRRIFEEFQQVDDSNTRQKGGTGLGLAISRRIVELHGGKIGVVSELGQGSTFRVEIPVNAEEATKAK